MKKISFVAVLFITLFMGCNKPQTNQIQTVSPAEMEELLAIEDIQLIDVRTPGEYEEGFIANFQNIDFMSPTFEADILKLDKSKPVILYCKSGGRSSKCAKKMAEAGFVKIYDLEGGISRWQHEGYEVETFN